MTTRLAVVMDPIESITPQKDSSLAMLLAAQRRGWSLDYLRIGDLYLDRGLARGLSRAITVRDEATDWFSLGAERDGPLGDFDVILMRVDPPFDMDYVVATYLLERAEQDGALVLNRPASLRDCNEKLFTAWFPELCPHTVVSASAARLKAVLAELGDAVIKPLDGMGGESIFRLHDGDPNTNVILEHLTRRGRRQAMLQAYLPAISEGDKRVLVVDGEVVPHALARIPGAGEHRGNLAAGGRGVPVPVGAAERRIAETVAPELVARGLLFVGLDVIGDKLTEINVTSPTCIRELDAGCGLDIGGQLMDAIARRLAR